jgi:hypothetical protein
MKENWLLFAISSAPSLSPVQLQKILFLFQKELPNPPKTSEYYRFKPYDYGPFDADIYIDAEGLEKVGLLTIENPFGRSIRRYSASDVGKKANMDFVKTMSKDNLTKSKEIIEFVISRRFPDLIKSIYDKYPEYKVNSVFRE